MVTRGGGQGDQALNSNLRELLDLVFRWIHLIAGIMWIGNSMLFNWLDRNLVAPENPKKGLIGEMWMVHSGGFYQVEKKQLAPAQMPSVLHWFKWQAYTTWITGIFLLGIVYYMGGGSFLVDPSVSSLSVHEATAVGLGALALAFATYDLVWRSPLKRHENIAVPLSLVLFAVLVVGLTRLLSARAAYIHVGAILGTVMAGNVFFHIMPSQRHLVRATIEGREQNVALGAHAKQRSIHNNYMTFPLLFIMISNHFPSTYAHKYNWLVLFVILIAGAGVRHFMNIRFTFKKWLPSLAAVVIAALATLFFLLVRAPSIGAAPAAASPTGEHVSFTAVSIVIGQRCLPCHSKAPADPAFQTAPNGVMFDSPEQVKAFSERIKARAVISKTMPLVNKTGMTDDERELLAKWVLEGAEVR
jgi:uncharacterized membrane protein